MSNPNPQHNPTDGLAVAAYVQVTGTNVVNNSGGAGAAQGTIGFQTGQGIGAVSSTKHPQAQYNLTLSLSSKTVNGVAYSSTCQLTTLIKDVANTTYTAPVNVPTYQSQAPSGAFYNPSNAISGNGLLANQVPYSAVVATVSAGGLITASHVGQTGIGIHFPTFDSVIAGSQNQPIMRLYAIVLVNVIP
jgi:hypothetical protein